jgi:hypothetical protein
MITIKTIGPFEIKKVLKTGAFVVFHCGSVVRSFAKAIDAISFVGMAIV